MAGCKNQLIMKCCSKFLVSRICQNINLVITVGCVPGIWCKGLITPVHKKENPLNPDNFRPICELSCLCKFFTNVLNSRLCLGL